jgi:hypothetical protein
MSDDFIKAIEGQNWPAYSHQYLYDMVRTDAAGASVLAEADQAWTEFTKVILDSRQRIAGLLRMAGATWEGVAADSMAAGTTPLMQWADDAGTAGQASGSGLHQVGESFSFTANAMPEPVNVEVTGKYGNVFAEMIDRDRQERLAHEAKQRAVELMERYSTSNQSVVSSLGVFVQPQDVAVSLSGPPSSGITVQSGGNVIVTRPPDVQRPSAETPAPSNQTPAGTETPATRHDSTETTATGVGGSGIPRGAGKPAAAPEAAIPAAANATTTAAAVAGPQRVAGGGSPSGTGIATGTRDARPGVRSTDRPAPEPGAGPVGGGRQGGGAGRAPGVTNAARAGAIGTGPAIAPAAAAPREDEREHVTPEYLHGYHDDFWGALPEASQRVLGEEPARD